MDDRPWHSSNTLATICLVLLFAAFYYFYSMSVSTDPLGPLP